MMTTLRSLRPLLLTLLCGISAATACAEADLPTSFEEPPVREEREDAKPKPRADMGTPAAELDQGTMDADLRADLEDLDMPVTQTDMPETGMPDTDTGLCPSEQCEPNTVECRGTTTYATCQKTIDGCWSFGRIDTCAGTSTCQDGACQAPPMCVDRDNDTYGENCAAGPDCDDTDRTVNPGGVEVCDNKDNNCNAQIDESIAGVGDSCTSGQGVCAASGSLTCDGAAQLLVCQASPGTPSVEVCDGLDNDCDGLIDEGGVCPCGLDAREPNETLATGYMLAQDSPTWNFTCATDKDFYRIPNTLVSGQQYAVILAYPVTLGEIQLTFYRNGVKGTTTSLDGTDHTGLRFTYDSNDTFAFEVTYNGTAENFYRINLIIEDVGCTSRPDFFEHNDTISTASLITSGWFSNAYLCGAEDDWYDLGNIPNNTFIDIETYFSAGIFSSGGNLDLQLYGDDDGDNIYDVVASAATSGSDEFLGHTTTHAGDYFLRVYSRNDVSNSYEIRMTR